MFLDTIYPQKKKHKNIVGGVDIFTYTSTVFHLTIEEHRELVHIVEKNKDKYITILTKEEEEHVDIIVDTLSFHTMDEIIKFSN